MKYPNNDLLVSKIQDIRHQHLAQISTSQYPKIWSSVSENAESVTVTIVIPSRGCSWALSEYGGCSVCGYVNDSSRDRTVPIDTIIERLSELLLDTKYTKKIEIQIFNSGSFFDEKDVSTELRTKIIDLITDIPEVYKLAVECRTEYIIKGRKIIETTFEQLKGVILEIGIGLESSNNSILRDCWNKGTTLENYKESVNILRTIGVKIKSYIFLKPPFLTERDAIRDTILTIDEIAQIGTDVISINPCNVQNGTLVNELFHQNKYRPPWLWSVLHIIQAASKITPDTVIICDPSAAGKLRGAHNCGKCDKTVIPLLTKAINGEVIPSDLSQICSCYHKWELIISTPWEHLRIHNISKLQRLSPLRE
jgi:radical SAM enzyme (TIGR01210 family)